MRYLILALLSLGGGFFAAVRYAAYRRRRVQFPAPESLIIQPNVDVSLNPAPQGGYILRWVYTAPLQALYTGDSPERIDRETPLPLNTLEGQSVHVPASAFWRPYYELHFTDGQVRLVSLRELPFDEIANFRDCGGYETHHGAYVQWGRIYRSGSLAHTTPADLQRLSDLGVRLVCDLRSYKEVTAEPDQLPSQSAPTYLHLPIMLGEQLGQQLNSILFSPLKLYDMLYESYTAYAIRENGPLFGEIFQRLAEEDSLPFLVHCTAGKDRTGITIALLLSVLGVPDETIIADYSISNRYTEHFHAWAEQHIPPFLKTLGVTTRDLTPLVSIHPKTMEKTLAFIREHYGSAEGYLRNEAKLSEAQIAQIRANFLTQ